MKNLCAKSRKPTERPWAVFNTPFGPARVLKLWSIPNGKSGRDAYTRVFVSCNGDLSDAYLFDYLRYGPPTEVTSEFATVLAEIKRLYPTGYPRPSLPF